MAAIALRLDRAGAWRLCHTVKDIRQSIADGVFAAVMHMEGCEAIGSDLAALEVFYAAGLRSLGLVWSRHNIFGHGVPFAFPMSPDTGLGLTEAGFELGSRMQPPGHHDRSRPQHRKGLLGCGGDDRPAAGRQPLERPCADTGRPQPDRQAVLDAIKESRGLVGLNYATAMLR